MTIAMRRTGEPALDLQLCGQIRYLEPSMKVRPVHVRGLALVVLLLQAALPIASVPLACCMRLGLGPRPAAVVSEAPVVCPMHHDGPVCPMHARAPHVMCASPSSCAPVTVAVLAPGSDLAEPVSPARGVFDVAWAVMSDTQTESLIPGSLPPDPPPPRA